jgi:hypothetical protein
LVVSVGVKASGTYPEQVWVRETNESEPPLKRRKPEIVVKTGSFSISQDKPVGYLATGQAAADV